MAGIIGRKIGMSSFFNEEGKSIPCTIVEAGPCFVTQIKSQENDGYSAVQIGYDDKKNKKTLKSELGHVKKANTQVKKVYVEFDNDYIKNDDQGKSVPRDLQLGDIIDVNLFKEGEFVDVTSNSKGKGFQGVVKRHNFRGVGDATHGQHNRMRAPGSIGAASYPARVFKGMRMAGQMGNKRVKVTNLQVMKVFPEKNLLVIKGAIPGPKNSYVIVEK